MYELCEIAVDFYSNSSTMQPINTEFIGIDHCFLSMKCWIPNYGNFTHRLPACKFIIKLPTSAGGFAPVSIDYGACNCCEQDCRWQRMSLFWVPAPHYLSSCYHSNSTPPSQDLRWHTHTTVFSCGQQFPVFSLHHNWGSFWMQIFGKAMRTPLRFWFTWPRSIISISTFSIRTFSINRLLFSQFITFIPLANTLNAFMIWNGLFAFKSIFVVYAHTTLFCSLKGRRDNKGKEGKLVCSNDCFS